MSLRTISTSGLTGCLLILATCTGAPVTFERMTAAELMAYNRTVGFGDQVFCIDEVRVGFISRRYCDTFRTILGREENMAESLRLRNNQ